MRTEQEAEAGALPRPDPVGAAYSELSASMALVASSCARCSLRTRDRTLLEVDMHGDVNQGSGGIGKMSRQRVESQ